MRRTILARVMRRERRFLSAEVIQLSWLRRVAVGKVQTKLVAGELYSKTDASHAPNIYKIAAVLDLNGDGKLEVIVHSFYYEGDETTIYRCEPDKIEPVLSVECGA